MTEIVAEISGNHGGKLENAFRLITEAKEAGADAVKFQCFDLFSLAKKRAKNPYVLQLAGGRDLVLLYLEIHTPLDWFPALASWADAISMPWFSSVFDPLDVDFLEALGCPRYKISAFEMLDGDLINAVVATGKPIIMSVRPMPGLTILQATDYEGKIVPLGLSAHGQIVPARDAPMVEYHLKLEGVETPDSEFSLTPSQFRAMVSRLR